MKVRYMKGTTNRICIYCIQNLVTGKRYIGSTINAAKRLSEHQQALKANRHPNQYLQRAWNKYGADSFEVTILETCESADQLVDCENAWILRHSANHRDFGYNTRLDAASSAGVRLSEEAKRKMSVAHKGRKQSPEHAAKQCAARTGAKRTPEQMARMAESRRVYDIETVKEIQRLLNEMPAVWGKKDKIGKMLNVHHGYVSRIANNPPKWLQNL